MSRLGGERDSVQQPIIDYAQEIGWEYIDRREATRLREGETGLFLKPIFLLQLHKLNPEFMNAGIADDLLSRLERVRPAIEGNLEAWEHLRGKRTAYVEAEKRERNVVLIDTEDMSNNVFHVTDEYSFTNGSKTIRQDIVFLINGVPVVFVETKSAQKRDGISSALEDVGVYHRKCPELLAVNQVYTLSNLARYFYSATWNTSAKSLFDWKAEAPGDFETIVKSFFDKERIVRLITDYILFTRKDDELSKVILRPHQMRAVSRIVERAEDEDKQRGLIWHTQGSGKTYTMIVAAKKIIENPVFENPTVLMLIDRNELQTQLSGNISAVGIEQAEIARSKRDLRRLLEGDTRGLIVSMIHKFDDIPEAINTRGNFFVLVDEAHRTTGGTLGNYLMGALPKATYIGFTGTPIDKTQYGQGTFVVFGREDESGYLDKYGIAESIADGTTVPLHYTLAPNELQVDRETLDREFLSLAEAEGVSDVDELNKVLEKAVTLRNMLKNTERIQKVTEYVVDHYQQTVEPLGYKAFLVGVDREACARYKQEIDKHLPSGYAEVVYSSGLNDDELLAQYHLSDEREKQIRKDFRKPDALPKILIVTEKLLTGYDAPILYCMFLDKPMRDHVLLQTIARVNRPYETNTGQRKPSGFILDFVGIFSNLEKALKFDSQDIEGVVEDIAKLKTAFEAKINEGRTTYLPIIEGHTGVKQIEALLNHFIDEDRREEFYAYFKSLAELYDILSPDAFLRPFIGDYETLADMYRIVRENYEHQILIDKEFSKKTAKLVQDHTRSGRIETSLEIYELDENLLKKIQESQASDVEKVFNLKRIIEKEIKDRGPVQPFLIPIGEKAERIIEEFKARQISTEEALERLGEIITDTNEARKERAEKDIPDEVFSIYWTLRQEGVETAEAIANEMLPVMEEFPHYDTSEAQEREIKKALYRVILGSGETDVKRVKALVDTVIRVLQGGRRES